MTESAVSLTGGCFRDAITPHLGCKKRTSQRGGSLFGGPLSDRGGHRRRLGIKEDPPRVLFRLAPRTAQPPAHAVCLRPTPGQTPGRRHLSPSHFTPPSLL